MKYKNVNKARLNHINEYIKATVEQSYQLGYKEATEEEKRKNANDLDDVTLMSLRSIKHCLENIIPKLEIVYCKDCEQCRPLTPASRSALGPNFIGKKNCDKFNIIVSGDDYCSFGKRKEDETR